MQRLVAALFSSKRAEDPVRTYDRAIRTRLDGHRAAEKSVERLTKLQEEMEVEVFERRAEIARLHDRALNAARSGADDSALSIITRKQALHEALRDVEEELRQLGADATEANRRLACCRDEIRELEREKAQALASITASQTRRDLRAAFTHATSPRQDEALERARRQVAMLSAERLLERELANEITDSSDDATLRARIELARMKEKRRRLTALGSGAD